MKVKCISCIERLHHVDGAQPVKKYTAEFEGEGCHVRLTDIDNEYQAGTEYTLTIA